MEKGCGKLSGHRNNFAIVNMLIMLQFLYKCNDEWRSNNQLPRTDITISSYNGSTPGFLFQIPGLKIGEKLLTGIWAFSPKNNDIKQNLLGDNVIEYFRPFQDNLNDCIYFIDNPNPEPYISPDGAFSLACDGVFLLENLKQ